MTPLEPTTAAVLELRKKYLGYRPNALGKVKGTDMLYEFTSWPFPEAGKVYIMARPIGDPTRNQRFEARRGISLNQWGHLRQKAYREGFTAGYNYALDEMKVPV